MAAATTASPLYGRDLDVAEVEARLGAGSVATLIGPGGVGKTALALEVARRMRPRLRDGARMVRLAPVREPNDVAPAIRLALAADTDQPLSHAIAAIDGLLVIDNGEHVIESVSALVDEVAALGGPVRLLITSRERTGVPAERVWSLAPLDPASALELLVARAHATDARALDPEASGPLQELLERVDRLPLGIEMLAPHLATLRPADLLEALGDRPDLLQTSNRAVDDRQRSLGSLVEWSLRLLSSDARDVLASLSVFAGPTPLDRAAAVLGRPEAELALGPLKELVDHSLVVADTLQQPTTYRLLETVRTAIADQRPPEIDRRHAEYVEVEVSTADAMMRAGDDVDGSARIDALVPDIRVAHRWARRSAVDLAHRLTIDQAQYAQERQWPEPAEWWLDPGRRPTDSSAAVAATVSVEAANRGDYDSASTLARHATTSDDHRVRAVGYDTLANVALYTGDTEQACRHGRDLISLSDETEDGYVRMLGVLDLVLGQLYGGDSAGARATLRGHASSASTGATTQAWFNYAEGEIASQEGRLDEAVRYFENAIALAGQAGGRFVAGVSEVGRLAALARGGEVAEALAAYNVVLERYRRIQNHTHAVTALRNAVLLLARVGADETAIRIVGSLRQDGTKSTYGSESEELDLAIAGATARHGERRVDQWLAEGSTRGVGWAIDQTIETIDRLRSGAE